MKIKTQKNKLILSSEINWWSRLIGIPFLLLGLLVFGSWLNGGMTDESGRQSSFGMALLIAAMFGLPGLGLGFGQIKFIVDRQAGTATRWLGAFFPFWKNSVPLSKLDKVALVTVRRSREGHSYTNYAVELSGPGGKVTSSSVSSPHECRRLARRVAVFAELPLHDTLKEITTPYTELSGNLRERLKHDRDKPESGPPPEGVSADKVGGTLKIRLEPCGLSFGKKFMFYAQIGGLALVGLPLLVTVLAALMADSAEPGLRLLALPWLLILVFLAFSASRVHLKTKREAECEEEIELSQSELVWKQTWRSQTLRKSFLVEDIQDLESDWGGLLVLSESDSVAMAAGAGRETREWLLSRLKGHLTER
ncbi:MAG: hypothetical protein KC800_19875 [Candidatus Eremiobacteraeota bacterium]|nr:hypothetical protein [Candidatus Eremiobacteraeota bacterium]